jgi:DNA-binding transcriptional LysR family regulator
MIQLHRLEGFYWVAKCGGYARAARAFPYPITQPAVHQQVKKLEVELGAKLFERLGKERLRLTAAGQTLYEFAAPFFDVLPGVVRGIQSGVLGGTLFVRAEPILLRYLLPAWLRRLEKRSPSIRVDLRELDGDHTGTLLRGDADLIVAYLEEVPAGIEVRRVGTLFPFLVLPASWKAAKKKHPNLDDLDGDATFISYTPGLLAHKLQMKALQEKRMQPRRTLAACSADTILGFVEAALGFSLLPSLDPRGPRARGVRAVPLDLSGRDFPVVAAWRAGVGVNPLVEAALETAPLAETAGRAPRV